MWNFPKKYGVIVVGGGHAGCEAAAASARMGVPTLMLTMNLDTIAKMSCNPAIGGVGKGHMVREIDALGGEMAKVTDRTGIQFRMLNASKGPAVWAPRAQADKAAYQLEMKRRLELIDNLDIQQGTVEDIILDGDRISGVTTREGILYSCDTLIVCSGTFLRGLMHLGDTHFSGGRAGDRPSTGISASLEKMGFELGRLKTGTPARVHAHSIDWSLCEEQAGEEGIRFSFDEEECPRLSQLSCHITYTTEETKQIIQENLHLSPLYSGKIQCVGPRYCPSIEDKVVRFADKERHQLFLEPEGLHTTEVYVNGLSTSLPPEVQLRLLHSIPAMRSARMMRPGYAIEYDYVLSGQIDFSLETRTVKGLFLAGQINGTTGYEEAAAQGLLAGVNAAAKIKSLDPLILKRSEAYIGVMVHDLVTKGVSEPYRMFTSRAEHRLLLRQDNADLRLTDHGHRYGLVSDERYARFCHKRDTVKKEIERLTNKRVQLGNKSVTLGQLLCRPEVNYGSLLEQFPDFVAEVDADTKVQIELSLKYKGYIEREELEVAKLQQLEKHRIPPDFNYFAVKGLRKEAQQSLDSVRPSDLQQALGISGVSPADISVLMVSLA